MQMCSRMTLRGGGYSKEQLDDAKACYEQEIAEQEQDACLQQPPEVPGDELAERTPHELRRKLVKRAVYLWDEKHDAERAEEVLREAQALPGGESDPDVLVTLAILHQVRETRSSQALATLPWRA